MNIIPFMSIYQWVRLFAHELGGMNLVKKVINIFLSLETSRKSKSSVRKVSSKDGFLTTDPRKIMAEVENYYTNMYKSEPLNP